MTIYGTDQISGVKLDLAYSVAVAGVSRGLGVDTIPFALGQKIVATDESVWLFCLVGAGGITGASYVCQVSEAFEAVMLTGNNALEGMRLGVGYCAATAGQYAWLQVYGVAGVQVAADCVEDVPLFTTLTPGVLDDDGDVPVGGIVAKATNGAEQAAVVASVNWGTSDGTGNAAFGNLVYLGDQITYGGDNVNYG